MTDIQPFVFEDQLVRSIVRNSEPWFIGRDVCHVLDIKNESHALSRLDEDERAEVAISDPSGTKTAIAVSEPGVFRLIFTSRKPEAERFKRWLAHDVLPSLRRNGRYRMGDTDVRSAEGEPFSIDEEGARVLEIKRKLCTTAASLYGPARGKALWEALRLPLPPVRVTDDTAEARDALNRILINAAPNGRLICDLIDEAMDGDEEARRALKACGIVAELNMEGVVIANRHPFLESCFVGSPWKGARWRHALRRLAGSSCSGQQRYGEMMQRGTFVPQQWLDFGRENVS